MFSAILKLFNPSAASAKKTVGGVLAAFNSAITDLDAVRTQSLAEAHEQEQQAILSTQAARAAREEAQRAAEVSDKLKSLIAA